jgi:hypothetical protein
MMAFAVDEEEPLEEPFEPMSLLAGNVGVMGIIHRSPSTNYIYWSSSYSQYKITVDNAINQQVLNTPWFSASSSYYTFITITYGSTVTLYGKNSGSTEVWLDQLVWG